MDELAKRVEMLEFQQRLLLRMLKNSDDQLYYLIVDKRLDQEETEELLKLCERMNKKFEKQKAEGYVTFYPLLNELSESLNEKISLKELVAACLRQGVFVEYMETLKQLLKD